MTETAARIVDVGSKDVTEREAVAEATITMSPQAAERLVAGTPKGDPVEAARVAALLAVKRTPELLPYCHPVALTGAEVRIDPDVTLGSFRIEVTVRARDRTGVEMEALTAATVAALCLYDAAKAYDRQVVITNVRLVSKRGGSGPRLAT